jgi:hypothetical protein
MTEDDVTISKFSKEAMGLGKDVYEDYEEEGTAPIVITQENLHFI